MNNRIVDIYINLMDFAFNAVSNQIKKLETDIANINKSVNDLTAKSIAVPDTVWFELNRKRELRKKLIVDTRLIEDLKSDIIRQKNSTLPDKQKIENVEKIVKPFFDKYRNLYTNPGEEVKLKKGESQFRSILKQTEKYEKISKKVDELEKRLESINAINTAKGITTNVVQQDLILKKNELEYKRILLKDKQRLVILSRQQYINKRNNKISKMQSEERVYAAKGDTAKAQQLNRKINKLRTKPIRLKSATSILLHERVTALFNNKRFDAEGNYDDRTWAEKRISEIESAETKKL